MLGKTVTLVWLHKYVLWAWDSSLQGDKAPSHPTLSISTSLETSFPFWT